MSRLMDWWHRKSKPAKVEVYTRWSFHSFALIEVSVIGLSGAVGGWLVLLISAHAALCAVLQTKALDWRLGRRGQPVRLCLAVAAMSLVTGLTALVLRRAGYFADDGDSSLLLIAPVAFGLGAVALGLRSAGHMTRAVLGAGAAVLAAALALGFDRPTSFGLVVGATVAGGAIVATYVVSAWLLNAVWELDTARELQARLAVAEERLRFGRDLHDVMGRNLAVIALKSELAVRLAARGRPEAADQMAEVQWIARESQREVRDVVRGYREADLRTELEGARGVLVAAGIDCRVEGDGGSGLPAGVQSALAWVVREAATNVLRHGDARRCVVRLTEHEAGEVVLVVENDGAPGTGTPGTGTPGKAMSGTGSGLAGLRERLAALNGTLTAGHEPHALFRLTARVPLPSPGPGGSNRLTSPSGADEAGRAGAAGAGVVA